MDPNIELAEKPPKTPSSPSSEAHSAKDLAMEDQEKTMMGQTPFPQQIPAEPAPPLGRLDSARPKSVKEQEEEEQQDPFAHLPEHEAAVLKRQVDIPPVKVTYWMLYRYATKNDYWIILVSAICAIAAGAVMPLMTIIFGNLAGTFQGLFNGTVEHSKFQGQINHMVLYFVYLGVGEFVTIYVSTVGFIYAGEHIAGKIRQQYLASILRQNIGYFDRLGSGEITTRITADTNLVQDGISEKVGLTLTAIATFVTAYVIAFIQYWRLALILTSTIVAIVVTMGIMGGIIVKYNKASLAAYATGGTVAEEVISSIRNATAFGTQDKLAREYDVHLTEAEKAGYRTKAITGSMIGFLMCYVYLNYALSFWQGSRYLVAGQMTLSQVLTTLLTIMIGAFSLGNVAPYLQAFNTSTLR